MSNRFDLLEKMFGSRTRVKMFHLFLTYPEQEYFVREIARTLEEQINSVRRELNNLEKIGVLVSEDKDKKKYYRANVAYELYPELRALVLKSRLTLEQGFVRSITDFGEVKYMSLHGYFVSDDYAEVDLFVIGDVGRNKLNAMLEDFQQQFDRQVRYTMLTPQEFRYRKEVGDQFLSRIMDSKKIVVHDTMTHRQQPTTQTIVDTAIENAAESESPVETPA